MWQLMNDKRQRLDIILPYLNEFSECKCFQIIIIMDLGYYLSYKKNKERREMNIKKIILCISRNI